MNASISSEFLKKCENSFDKDAKNLVAMNAVCKNGILESATSYNSGLTMRHEYSVNILEKDEEITNQKQSGRCWMFASLNTMRFQVMKNLNLGTFELSQAYPLFYDKLEKSNYFLESILDTLDEPTNGRLIAFLLSSPLGDGGQWDMFCNLTEKYGVVPKDIMPESNASSSTRYLVSTLTEKLREDACILRKESKNGAKKTSLRAMKDQMMSDIYKMLCISLGKPPLKFTFEVRDKDGKFIRDTDITPQEFFKKYVKMDLSQYVSLINAPTDDKPYFNTYTVKFLGNVKEGRPVKYLNLPIEDLKKAAISQLKSGEPVWFGCDVGQRSTRDNGIMDQSTVDYENLFGVKFGMNKAERLDYGESLMTHAMVFHGVNIDKDGKPDRWRVENSWGKDAGKDGYYIMSDKWFDEYMYQIVVNKKFLTKKELSALEKKPIELEPWDPMGSLAK
jgi:bleomycin hydrolase